MTAISDIYDGLLTRVSAQLTSHNRLTNPFTIEANNDDFLRQGYTIRVVGGSIADQQSCMLLHRTDFEVIITREHIAPDFNVGAKDDVIKNLLEDVQLIMDDFEKEPSISGSHDVLYQGHSSIEPVDEEKDNILSVIINMTATFSRNL